MKLKPRLYYKAFLISLLFVSGLAIAALIFPALAVLCKPANAKLNRDALKLAWLHWFAAIVGLSISVEGVAPHKPCLFVSNHVSWLDIIVLGGVAPAHFVAKSDILSWPIIGYLAKQGGTVFVRRGEKQQAKAIGEEMLWLLKQNSTVIAFPEGTTTKGDVVLPFHASLFQPALLVKANVQPIALEYLGESKGQAPFVDDDTFVPHLLRILSLDKVEVRVVFHPMINTAGKTRQSVSGEARALIMDSMTDEKAIASTANMRRQL
jgi:lyso-ornithine lipid O-acyltransferase